MRPRARALLLALACLAVLPASGAAQLPPLPAVPGTPQPPPDGREPPPPAQPPPADARAGGASYFGNPSGNGVSAEQALFGPLQRLWTKSYRQLANHPLIAGGKVLVNVNDQEGYGSEVIAYDPRSGTELWRRATPGVYFSAHLAAAGDRVVAVNSSGVARAFALDDGRPLWEAQTDASHGGVPVAADGVLYVHPGGSDARLTAYSMADGRQLWSAPSRVRGGDGMPVLDDRRVYLADDGGRAVAVARDSGRVVWERDGDSGLGVHAAVHGGRLHAGGRSFDAATGAEGPRVGAQPGAFAGELGIVWNGAEASGVALDGTGVRWTFKNPRQAAPGGGGGGSRHPLVVGPTAYVASGSSWLFGLDAATGELLSETKLPDPGHVSVGGGRPGMDAGAGVLVVNHGLTVTAYEPVLQPPPGGADLAASAYDVSAGKQLHIAGGVATDLRAARPELTLEVDTFPFGRYSAGARTRALADGAGYFLSRPPRNTRYRIRVGGAVSKAITVYALPRIRSSLRATSRGTALLRATLRAGPDFDVAGRRFFVYFGRASSKRFELIGSGRMVAAGRGRVRTSVRVRLPRRVGRDDVTSYCIPGLARLGYGRNELFERRCGRARIPFE